MLEKNGIPTPEQVKSVFPPEALLVRAKAVLECYEEIPCNPCETNCPAGAIHIGEDINARPVLDAKKCTGCGICVGVCPGLAILTVSLKGEDAVFQIPWEFLPVPKEGDVWIGTDRAGRPLGDAKILRVRDAKGGDRTRILTVSLPRQHLYDFVTVRCPE